MSRVALRLAVGGALVAAVAAAVTISVTRSGPSSHTTTSARARTRFEVRPHFATRAAACAVEADASSDVLIANGTSDAITEQIAAVTGPGGDGGTLLQIMLGGVSAYNSARQPPANASAQTAVLAMTRRNGELCTTLGNPILTRVQVRELAQLAGQDALLLSDVDVFADSTPTGDAATVASGQTTIAVPSGTATPAVEGEATVADCAGQTPATRPRTLHVRCGNGAVITITGIGWQKWGGAQARGHGTVHVTDCVPDCVHGQRTSAPVGITLSNVQAVAGGRRYTLLDAIPAVGDSLHITLPT